MGKGVIGAVQWELQCSLVLICICSIKSRICERANSLDDTVHELFVRESTIYNLAGSKNLANIHSCNFTSSSSYMGGHFLIQCTRIKL